MYYTQHYEFMMLEVYQFHSIDELRILFNKCYNGSLTIFTIFNRSLELNRNQR